MRDIIPWVRYLCSILLGLLLTQALSGTMSRDDLLFEGPFSYWAGDFSGTMTDWHEINWRLLAGIRCPPSCLRRLVPMAQTSATVAGNVARRSRV